MLPITHVCKAFQVDIIKCATEMLAPHFHISGTTLKVHTGLVIEKLQPLIVTCNINLKLRNCQTLHCQTMFMNGLSSIISSSAILKTVPTLIGK